MLENKKSFFRYFYPTLCVFVLQILGNLQHEEDLAVIAFRAVVTTKLKIAVTKFRQAPIMRVEVLGNSASTHLEIQELEKLQLGL